MRLKVPTADTRELLRCATELLTAIFRPGFKYSKAGIVLSELCTQRTYQADLLSPTPDNAAQERSDRLMAAIDRINRHGHDHKVFWAAQGTKQDQVFKNQHSLSPRYTTNWDELPEIE